MPQRLLLELDEKPHPRRSTNQLNELSGKEWIQSTVSVWFQRGLGKDHAETRLERLHPAPFAFLMVERLLKFFTKKADSVLDPFSGVGSTLKACELLGRQGTGVELSEKWHDIARKRLSAEAGGGKHQHLILGDARKVLKDLADSSFDFVVSSPPYWNILNKPADYRVKTERLREELDTRYSDDPRDLANLSTYPEFLASLEGVFRECYRVLRHGKFIAIVVSDFRHKSRYVAFHSDVGRLIEATGFVPKGVIIYVKNAKKLYPYGYPFDFVPNIHHEYILIMRKPNGANGAYGAEGAHRSPK